LTYIYTKIVKCSFEYPNPGLKFKCVSSAVHRCDKGDNFFSETETEAEIPTCQKILAVQFANGVVERAQAQLEIEQAEERVNEARLECEELEKAVAAQLVRGAVERAQAQQ
jgi:hypothetical protein